MALGRPTMCTIKITTTICKRIADGESLRPKKPNTVERIKQNHEAINHGFHALIILFVFIAGFFAGIAIG